MTYNLVFIKVLVLPLAFLKNINVYKTHKLAMNMAGEIGQRESTAYLFPECEKDEECPADRYAKAVLAVFEQPFGFSDDVMDFLTENAAFVEQNVYHLGNSTVWYRTDILPEHDEYENAMNVTLNFTARTKSELEESMAMVTKKFPVFKEYSHRPDPLFMKLFEKKV